MKFRKKLEYRKVRYNIHKDKISKRIDSSGTDFWETDEGRLFIVRSKGQFICLLLNQVIE